MAFVKRARRKIATKLRALCERYASRNGPPPGYPPPLVGKPIPPLMGSVTQNEPPPGYRGRYEPPSFGDNPPGVDPPVPGFEPSPFEKPPFGTSGTLDRERLPPPNYRDPYRAPFVEGPPGYRDASGLPPVQGDIPVHTGDHPQRFRDNFRPPPGHFRDQGPVSYRDGQPYRDPALQVPYRDANFRNGPQPLFRDSNYRNNPYREGNFRENLSHNNFRDGPSFRPPSTDSRDPVPVAPYHDPNYRDGLKDENNVNRDMRTGYRTNVRNRSGPRRNPNSEHDRPRDRDRDGRERERFNETREPTDRPERPRENDKRSGYDKNREPRDDRIREYDRNRDYEKERGHDKSSPEKKTRVTPKRGREARERKRSESRGKSRDHDSRREKKEERVRDKSSADRSKDHKDKEKKIKERKKKKREKEKELEKKKKREKKEKKEKDVSKKEDDNLDKPNNVQESQAETTEDAKKQVVVKTEPPEVEKPTNENIEAVTTRNPAEVKDDLYGDESAETVDKEIIQNYIKTEQKDEDNEINETKISDSIAKEEPFDGIELQVPVDELEADIEGTTNNCSNNKEMLAPLPVLSKWEVDDDNVEKSKEPGEITSPDEEEKVTSEVLKRAENAIFAKAINSLRPIEIKKISSDRLKLYGDEAQTKNSLNNIQITVPVSDQEQKPPVELNDRKKRYSKTPPPRLSVKERLGGKVDDIRRTREPRVVHSTVERVKSRSKTPKHEQMQYRRVTVERERGRKPESRGELSKSEKRAIENVKSDHQSNNHSEYKKRDFGRPKDEKKLTSEERAGTSSRNQDKNAVPTLKESQERERKKSTLDEAHFEPDYDETVESDNETKEETNKKRSREPSSTGVSESKKAKYDSETIKLDLTNVKKKPESESESTSDSQFSTSSSSSDARKRKKKKKRSKKKKKRAASDSDSDSESSSDDHKKKKKKRKHKKKSSKKKKKSKHK